MWCIKNDTITYFEKKSTANRSIQRSCETITQITSLETQKTNIDIEQFGIDIYLNDELKYSYNRS